MQIKTFQPVDHKVKALIYGPSGSGKTVFGGTAPKPIFASAEGGLLSIADKQVPFVEIKSLKDLSDLLHYLRDEKHDFETVIIDSISEINDIIKQEIEKKTGRSMQIQDWGDLGKKIKSIFRGFRDLPMHTLLIAQEMIEKDEDKIEKIVPSLNGKASTEISYFMDIVGYIFVEKTGNRKIITSSSAKLLTKDRSNKIGNETEVDFSVWVDKVKGITLGEQKVIIETEKQVEESVVEIHVDAVVEEKVETPIDNKKLPATRIKELQGFWKEYCQLNKWNLEEVKKKKVATLQTYYKVNEFSMLTIEQLENLIEKIKKAILDLQLK